MKTNRCLLLLTALIINPLQADLVSTWPPIHAPEELLIEPLLGNSRVNGILQRIYSVSGRCDPTECGRWLESLPGKGAESAVLTQYRESLVLGVLRSPWFYSLELNSEGVGYLSVLLIEDSDIPSAPQPQQFGLPRDSRLLFWQQDHFNNRSVTTYIYGSSLEPSAICRKLFRNFYAQVPKEICLEASGSRHVSQHDTRLSINWGSLPESSLPSLESLRTQVVIVEDR